MDDRAVVRYIGPGRVFCVEYGRAAFGQGAVRLVVNMCPMGGGFALAGAVAADAPSRVRGAAGDIEVPPGEWRGSAVWRACAASLREVRFVSRPRYLFMERAYYENAREPDHPPLCHRQMRGLVVGSVAEGAPGAACAGWESRSVEYYVCIDAPSHPGAPYRDIEPIAGHSGLIVAVPEVRGARVGRARERRLPAAAAATLWGMESARLGDWHWRADNDPDPAVPRRLRALPGEAAGCELWLAVATPRQIPGGATKPARAPAA